ncbi:MAG TPA: FAD-dependent monooxygenase [Actinocrinis sp.]|nr:FAD-dependent monooxygenase [Actinocrinis sp.]
MSGRQLQELALSMLPDWHPVVREIVADQTPASIFPVTVRTSVPGRLCETGPITLLGDAVHAMSPAIGVGANTALRDAQVLSGRLAQVADGNSLHEAVHAYEEEMSGYGFDVVRESAQRGQDLVGQNPLPAPES